MANIVEVSEFPEDIPLIDTGEPVRGGPDGADNRAPKLLANRTRYLYDQFQALVVGGLNVIGTLNNQAALDAIPTGPLVKGDAYFVEGALHVWNMVEWVNSGSLLGPRGITLLGAWPDGVALPDPTSNSVGDAYVWKSDIWLLIPQPDGWVTIGLKGDKGDSAYDVAVEDGFAGTKPQWLTSLVGKSTYQIWIDQGNVGTEADFLLSLKGAAGSVGSVKVIGTLASEAELDAIPTEGMAEGTAYFVQGALRVWNGIEWTDSGSLLGDRGITLLGTWPDTTELPSWEAATIGDAYIWRSDLWLLVPGGDGTPPPEGQPALDPAWSPIGLEGPEGDSAYDVAVQTGFVGTKPQWLATLVGKSAYQTWLDLGNVGDQQAFLDTLKSVVPGPPGDEGPARSPFEVMGAKASIGQLPATGVATEAWYVGSHLYVWVTTLAQYVDLGSVGGMSAYELAVEDGFGGTLQQWLESLKSTVEGPTGPRGQNLNVKGTVASQAFLSSIQGVVEQDAYVTDNTGHLWVYVDAAWVDIGPFQGKSVYQVWIDQGHSGDEATFLQSLQGVDGKDGVNIVVKGSVATFSALTATPAEQDVYSVRDTNTLYAYVGGGWIPLGTFKGADGVDGNPGTNGSSITIIKILTPEDQVVPDAAANAGKAYVDLNKHLQLALGGQWYDGGAVGATGDRGPQGTGINLRGTVTGTQFLPRVDQGAVDGDGYFIASSKLLYVMVDAQWEGPFDIIGPEGPPGANGEKGEAGTSINILGAYATLGELSTAHPTGNLGDGYLVGNNLAIWTTANGGEWIDIGLVRGPQGIQGVPGPSVIGPRGFKGDKGASWITLPAGDDEPGAGFTGNIGDWAVSDTFKVYYKSAVSGWTYWGQLVAGDVNSPVLSFGKAVRLGNEWIVLPVDEVPNMVDGKLYVRSLISGNTGNEGEWVELVFPDPFDDAPDDGNKYLRTRANGQPAGTWALLPSIIPEVPDDGKTYGRKNPVGSGGADALWIEVVPEPPVDSNLYGRKGDKTWQVITGGFADVPTDGNFYLRKGDHSWSQFIPPTLGDLGGVPTSALGVSVATLVGGFVPSSQLPSYVDDVLEFANQAAFPGTGETGKIYIAKDTNVQYRWSGTVYIALVASPGTTDAVVEGTTNLYFTQTRVRTTPLTGLSLATNSAIAATDTVITAFGKLQAQITAFVPGFADVPTDANLYLRKGDHTWSVYTGVNAPANDGHQWIYKGGVWVSFDRYDLAIQAISATATIDPAVNLFAKVDNSAATAKTITLADGPKVGGAIGARALTVVVKINGAAGTITFAATGATVLVWNGGSPPGLTGSRTVLTFLWDGVEWTGASGAVVP